MGVESGWEWLEMVLNLMFEVCYMIDSKDYEWSWDLGQEQSAKSVTNNLPFVRVMRSCYFLSVKGNVI